MKRLRLGFANLLKCLALAALLAGLLRAPASAQSLAFVRNYR